MVQPGNTVPVQASGKPAPEIISFMNSLQTLLFFHFHNNTLEIFG